MKLLKVILLLCSFFLVGNQYVNAQQKGEYNREEFRKAKLLKQKQVAARSTSKKRSKPVTGEKAKSNRLFSKEEVATREKTAQKTKVSGKGSASPEKAKQERAARIAAKLATHKRKNTSTIKRNN